MDDQSVRTPRANPERSSNEDPLAELARLIGRQEDPFIDPARDPAPAQPRYSAPPPSWHRAAPTEEHAYETEAPAPDWLSRPIATKTESMTETYPAAAPAMTAQHDQYAAHHADATAPVHPHDAAADYYADPYATAPAHEADPHAYPQDAAYDPNYDQYYAEDGVAPAHAEEVYEEAPRQRRRGGLAVVLALLGVAVLGTAGAFAYRTYTHSATLAEPKVVKADDGPIKVPPDKVADSVDKKLIYDRVGDKTTGEKVIPREENPVEVVRPIQIDGTTPNTTAAATVPAVPPTPAPAAVETPTAMAPPAQPGRPPASEPKKVRTTIIRPDAPQPESTPAAPNPVRAEVAPPAPPAAPAPRAPVAHVQPAPSPNAPMSIAPTRLANVPPQATPHAPVARAPHQTRTAAINPTGGFVVQVTSQRSERDAQTSFHSLQVRYPQILGTRQPLIRRVDLGDKGVYYRAQVGPFADANQAQRLCASLRAAGGQCIVQRN